jgi:hypothetical protein
MPATAATVGPQYKDGLLTIPNVDATEQAGKYQDVEFLLGSDGSWQLVKIKELGTLWLQKALVDSIEIIKTDTFPVSVYLRASGWQSNCGFDGPARVHQRITGNNFDVIIGTTHTAEYVHGEIGCLMEAWRFKMTVQLNVYGLSAGNYSFKLNDKIGSFSLDRDNKLADDCDAASETGCR